ncbi:MAG: extracellular solute-binding protein, partial [Kiritimatiellota bacterium]|nr:extracellular solute-binding protein [Kiritimatiellota bacterium]
MIILCGAHAAENKIPLKVAKLPPRPAVGPWAKAFLEGFETFIRRHPDVELSAAAGISPPQGMGAAGELTAIAAGTAPDVFDTALDRVAYYAEQGFLRPLDDFLAEELAKDPDFIRKHYIPDHVWQACHYKGKCYAIPWYYGHYAGFIYRKDLMRKAGIDPPRAPADWDDLLYMAMKCTYPEKDQYGLHIRAGANSYYEFNFFLGAAGGDIVVKIKDCPQCRAVTRAGWLDEINVCAHCGAKLADAPARWQLTYASDAGVKALRFLKRLCWCQWVRGSSGEPYELPFVPDPDTAEPLYVTGPDVAEVTSPQTGNTYPVPADKRIFKDPRTGENLWNCKVNTGVIQMTTWGWEEFLDGKHVMRLGGLDFFGLIDISRSGLDPANVGFGPPPPIVKDGKSYVETGGSVLAINSRLKEPRQLRAAWDHVKYMSGDYWGVVTKCFVEAGYGHFMGAIKLKRFGFAALAEQFGEEQYKYELKMLKLARVPAIAPQLGAIKTSDIPNVMDAILRQKDGYAVDVKKLLAENQRSAQDRVLGTVDPRDMARKRKMGWAVLAVLLPLALFTVVRNIRSQGTGTLMKTAQSSVGRGRRSHLFAWLLFLPAVLTVLLWQYIPLVWGSIMAFLDYRIMGGSSWVGLDNFIKVFSDQLFFQVIVNTFIYVGLSMLLGFLAPIILAVLLSEAGALSVPFRVIYYLPHIISSLVIAFLWKLMYLPTDAGYLNQLVTALGVPAQTWLNDKNLAMVCVILPGVWAGMGAASLIYLAGLKTVPEDLYEAVALDGGGLYYKIRHIMYPALRGLILINFIGSFIGGFHAMQNIFVMTG